MPPRVWPKHLAAKDDEGLFTGVVCGDTEFLPKEVVDLIDFESRDFRERCRKCEYRHCKTRIVELERANAELSHRLASLESPQ